MREPSAGTGETPSVLTTFRDAGPGSAIHRVSMNDLFEKGRRAGPRIASAKDAMDRRVISIRGAREHNLKNIDVEYPARPARGVHRPVRLGQILARLRHHLCRGPAPLRREPVGLCAAVPGDDAEAGRRPDRRPVARHLHRAEDHLDAIRARRSAPSPRSTTTCGCSGRASACPIRRRPACRSRARPCRRWSTACWRCPKARGFYLLAPVVRGRKGEYRKELAEFLKKGYQRVKIDGTFYEIARGPAARQEVHPRHRRGGRPPGGAPRHFARGLRTRSSRRSSSPRAWRSPSWPTAAPTARREGQRQRRNETAERLDLLGKIRLPGVRLHHSGDRAAAVLVQQPVRRLPEMRRARRRAAHRRRPGHPRQGRAPCARARSRRGRNRRRPTTCRRCDALGKHYSFTLDTKWKDLPKKTQDAILYGSGDDEIRFAYDDGMRAYETKKPFEGVITNLERRYEETESDWAREEIAELFHRRAVRSLQRLSAQARGAVRQDRRQAYRRSLRAVGQSRSATGSPSYRQRLDRQAERDRRPRAQGNPRRG